MRYENSFFSQEFFFDCFDYLYQPLWQNGKLIKTLNDAAEICKLILYRWEENGNGNWLTCKEDGWKTQN